MSPEKESLISELKHTKSEILYWACSSNYHNGIGKHIDDLMQKYFNLLDQYNSL